MDLCGLYRFPLVPAKVFGGTEPQRESLLSRAGERWDEWADSDGGEQLDAPQTGV